MPGVTGLAIAGLWYLLLAFVAPLVATVRWAKGAKADWGEAWLGFSIAVAMVAAFVATGWGIGFIVSHFLPGLAGRTAQLTIGSGDISWVQVFGVVLGILAAIQLAAMTSVWLRRRRRAV